MNKRSSLKRRLSFLLAFLLAVAFVIVQAGQAAEKRCQKQAPESSARLTEIRLLERLTAKLTNDLRLLGSAQGSKASAVQKSSPSKYSLLQQKIQSLERRKTLLSADKGFNLPTSKNMTGQKSRAAGRQVSINSFPGSISGKVMNNKSNSCSDPAIPAVNVYVLALDFMMLEYPEYSGEAYTDENGDYTINNLAADGDYYVFIDGATATVPNCNFGYYDKDAPNHININIPAYPVKADPPNKLADVTLTTCSGCGGGGSITGTMSGDYGVGISGHVDVYDENYKWVASVRTEDGSYTVNNLPAGKYKLFFDADTEYISEWYDDPSPQPPPGDFCTVTSKGIVTVDAGGTTTPAPPFNAQLHKGTSISGKVTDSTTPMIGVFVDVFSEKYPSLYEFDYTDPDGNYTLSGLPPGDGYKVRFKPANDLHAMQWCGGKYDFDQADPSATGGSCDAQLALGGSVSGKVTSEQGSSPVKLALVNAEVTTSAKGTFSAIGITDEYGNYTISGLPISGGYKAYFLASFIEYSDGAGKYYHVNEWYSGKADPSTANTFAVSASGINAQLAVGGSISGKATDGSGNPAKGVMVEVYHDNAGTSIAAAATDEQGNYIVTGVPYGKNKVRFFVDSQNGYCSPAHTCYVGWYGGSTSQDAIEIELTAPQRNITGINAVLSSCGGISGTVTDDSAARKPVADVRVEVYNRTLSPAGNVIASGITDKDGKYTIIGVPSSSDHKVKFVADSLGYSNQWHDGQEKESAAELVEVKASETTQSVDAALSKPASAVNSAAIVPIIKTLLLP